MQEQILEQNPDADLRVYAIWTERLFLDSRALWDGAGLDDPRVVHLWDDDDLAGPWFAEHQPDLGGVDWDFYLLYDADAAWDDAPVDTGFSVRGEGERLVDAVTPLIR